MKAELVGRNRQVPEVVDVWNKVRWEWNHGNVFARNALQKQ